MGQGNRDSQAPRGSLCWFGKTQGRIYTRIPRPGCFHIACLLSFPVLNPGGILLVRLPSGRSSPGQLLHPRPWSSWTDRECSEHQANRVSNYLYSFLHESDVNYQVSFPKHFLKLQQPPKLPPPSPAAEVCRGDHRLQQLAIPQGAKGAGRGPGWCPRWDTGCHRARQEPRGPARSTSSPSGGARAEHTEDTAGSSSLGRRCAPSLCRQPVCGGSSSLNTQSRFIYTCATEGNGFAAGINPSI